VEAEAVPKAEAGPELGFWLTLALGKTLAASPLQRPPPLRPPLVSNSLLRLLLLVATSYRISSTPSASLNHLRLLQWWIRSCLLLPSLGELQAVVLPASESAPPPPLSDRPFGHLE